MHGPVDAVYVHIPFCVKKCGYCDFYSLPLRSCDKGAAEDYTAHVIRESAHWPGNRYDTVYFGGGTPSLLTPGQIGKILAALAPLPGAEITLEANPGTVDLQSLKDYRAAGVNRLSLGIQSLQDRFLKLLGRIHSAADALEAYESAQKAGYENISLDMMFALPGQTLDELDAELERFFALSPAHLSIYALTWEEGTPFWEKRREGLLRPVENESEAAMFERIMEKAKACGYQHYEISNFARGRKISRHNIKY
ncbi:MAG: radical SAM family heme chaperone HemW, partial [Fusobacteriaceae bacterium]|nr:radical SAM family heme chaperone HemW [Fusobacteriaceae bacterium]